MGIIPVEVREANSPTLAVIGDPGTPRRVALLSGSFDPLTLGHTALAEAALAASDLVVLAYSVRTLPKQGDGPPPLLAEEPRLEIVLRWCDTHPGTALGICSHGLLVEQTDAARARFPGAQISLVLGSDKAMQLFEAGWYLDRDAELDRLFGGAEVLYAERSGDEGRVERLIHDAANERWAHRVRRLEDVAPGVAAISSREVRAAIDAGTPFAHLVPPESADALA